MPVLRCSVSLLPRCLHAGRCLRLLFSALLDTIRRDDGVTCSHVTGGAASRRWFGSTTPSLSISPALHGGLYQPSFLYGDGAFVLCPLRDAVFGGDSGIPTLLPSITRGKYTSFFSICGVLSCNGSFYSPVCSYGSWVSVLTLLFYVLYVLATLINGMWKTGEMRQLGWYERYGSVCQSAWRSWAWAAMSMGKDEELQRSNDASAAFLGVGGHNV